MLMLAYEQERQRKRIQRLERHRETLVDKQLLSADAATMLLAATLD